MACSVGVLNNPLTNCAVESSNCFGTFLIAVGIEAAKVTAVALVIIFTVNAVVPNAVGPTLFYALATAPILEEIIYRGVFQSTLELIQSDRVTIGQYRCGRNIDAIEPQWKKTLRVFATAILFGAAHKPGVSMVFATIFGISAGYCKEKTHSIAPTIVYHAVANGLVMVILEVYLRNINLITKYNPSIYAFHAALSTSILALDAFVYIWSTRGSETVPLDSEAGPVLIPSEPLPDSGLIPV